MGLSYRRGRRGASKFPKTTLARFLTLVISGCGLSNIVFAEQCTKAHFLKSEIDSEQYIKAMELAESCREETEGDVLFDYNYGRAAYLVQQYDKAVFAIERVIANEPNNYQAHMLLGAIYSKMGNVKAAAYEWTYVKANAQDPDTIAHAETLLKTFSDESFEQYWQASLEVGFGFDDNLNLGIDRDSINLNGVDVEIVDERREQDSFFNDVAAEGTYLFSKNNAVNLRFWHRGYYDGQQQTEFTLRNIYTASELRFPITLSAELRPLLIDGEFARLVTSLSGLVDLNPNNKVLRPQLITRLTHLTFDERDQERVRGMIGFGLGYKPSAWQHYANVLASNEWPVQPEGKEFARKAIGISYMVGYHYQEGSVTSFSTSYQDYLYQKEFTGSDELRSSTLFYATLKHEWAITDASEFNAMYRYVEGASNIDFFDYQRNFMRIGYAYKF